MEIRLDRNTCIGMFQCVAEWDDGFERDEDAGKVTLLNAEELSDGVFEAPVPGDAELDAKFAARACPVDALEIYEDGEQVV
ncbi:MAG: ferredoxin [Halanaeroarchaeum sp.]